MCMSLSAAAVGGGAGRRGERLYFAGEACSVDAFQCVSGAMESGQRVAERIRSLIGGS
jgi:monoamine oxidase